MNATQLPLWPLCCVIDIGRATEPVRYCREPATWAPAGGRTAVCEAHHAQRQHSGEWVRIGDAS